MRTEPISPTPLDRRLRWVSVVPCILSFGLLGLLGACSDLAKLLPAKAPATSLPITPRSGPIEKPGAAKVLVNELDNGATIVLGQSQVLEVALKNTAGSTLDWVITDPATTPFNVLADKFELGRRDRDFTEQDGDRVFLLRPKTMGNLDLQFDLRLPRSLEPPVQSVRFKVIVK